LIEIKCIPDLSFPLSVKPTIRLM